MLDKFMKGYITAALWSTTDEADQPLDKKYIWTDISVGCYERMATDCNKFLRENEKDIDGEDEQAGHDFWLTRNHHGAGFWDSPEAWQNGAHRRLTDAAHEYPEVHLYIADGLIHS